MPPATAAVLRAFEDNELDIFGFVLHKIFLFGLVFLSIKLHFELWALSSPISCANVLLWNFYHLVVSRLYARIPLVFDVPLWKCSPFVAAVGWRRHASSACSPARHPCSHLDDKSHDGRLIQRALSNQHGSADHPTNPALPLFPLYSRTAHLSREPI